MTFSNDVGNSAQKRHEPHFSDKVRLVLKLKTRSQKYVRTTIYECSKRKETVGYFYILRSFPRSPRPAS